MNGRALDPGARFRNVIEAVKAINGEHPEIQVFLEQLEKISSRIKTIDDLNEGRVQVALRTLELITVIPNARLKASQKEVAEKDGQVQKLGDAVKKLRNIFKVSPMRFGSFEWLEMGVGEDAPRVFMRPDGYAAVGVAVLDEGGLVEALKKAQPGQRIRYVTVDGMMVVVGLEKDYETAGEVVDIGQLYGDGRVKVHMNQGGEHIVRVSGNDMGEALNAGDKVVLSRHGFITQKIADAKVQELVLESSPNVRWEDIGGLDDQIREFREKVETPFLYPGVVKAFSRPDLKGVLLVGPPGTGKTMLAKATVSELAQHLSRESGRPVQGFHIVVNGPADVLRSLVGDSPGRIKSIFKQARDAAKLGHLVFIIFDEFESLFTTRNVAQLDAGVGKQLVTQINAELDGIEKLRGVMVLGLTNRPDMIDPAVIRPGRFDLKIPIPRPSRAAAKDIFCKTLRQDAPLHAKYRSDENYEGEWYFPRDASGQRRVDEHKQPLQYALNRQRDRVIDYFAEKVIASCYDDDRRENRYFKVVFLSGKERVFTFGNFMSGALIVNIINEAKDIAMKRCVSAVALLMKNDVAQGKAPLSDNQYLTHVIETQGEGLKLKDFYDALDKVFRNERTLPTANEAMREWLEVEGFDVEDIRRVVPLMSHRDKTSSDDRSSRRTRSSGTVA